MDSCGGLAVKLLRTYTAQAEALAKLRRGGEQTVRVEHVHVHAGGQAVVGNVNQRETGGLNESSGQPHAAGQPRALTFTPGYKHGQFTSEALWERKTLAALLKALRANAAEIK